MNLNVFNLIIGAIIPLLIGATFAIITQIIRRNVTIQSPERKVIAQIVPTINILLEIQGPQLESIIALLECSQGTCNGNVDKALDLSKQAYEKYKHFLKESAKVEIT